MNIHTLAKGEQVQKYHVALLVNSGTSDAPTWVQIEKSTDNTITMNGETEDRDFITDEQATTILKKYKPSMSEPITLFKGNPDYEYFWDKFYNTAVGSNSMSEILVVFMNETDSADTSAFKAWKCACSLVCDSLNPVDGTLTFSINFNGTIAKGTVTVSSSGEPTFTESTSTSSASDTE